MTNKYIGPKRLTRFERSRIIGARALQLSQGAPRLVNPPPDITNSIVISELELQERILPLTIRRTLPNGEFVDISLKTLTQVTKPSPKRRKKTQVTKPSPKRRKKT
ncbi:MAG: DNA-directed RNA polymerase subunit K [Candidatus Ranarchaeia archaeon]